MASRAPPISATIHSGIPVKGRVPLVAVCATAFGAFATAPSTPPAGCSFAAALAGETAPATPPAEAFVTAGSTPMAE